MKDKCYVEFLSAVISIAIQIPFVAFNIDSKSNVKMYMYNLIPLAFPFDL